MTMHVDSQVHETTGRSQLSWGGIAVFAGLNVIGAAAWMSSLNAPFGRAQAKETARTAEVQPVFELPEDCATAKLSVSESGELSLAGLDVYSLPISSFMEFQSGVQSKNDWLENEYHSDISEFDIHSGNGSGSIVEYMGEFYVLSCEHLLRGMAGEVEALLSFDRDTDVGVVPLTWAHVFEKAPPFPIELAPRMDDDQLVGMTVSIVSGVSVSPIEILGEIEMRTTDTPELLVRLPSIPSQGEEQIEEVTQKARQMYGGISGSPVTVSSDTHGLDGQQVGIVTSIIVRSSGEAFLRLQGLEEIYSVLTETKKKLSSTQ